MFQSNLFRIDRSAAVRIYCILFIALLTVGNVWAEDDAVEIDPNGFTSVVELFRNLLNFVVGLVA